MRLNRPIPLFALAFASGFALPFVSIAFARAQDASPVAVSSPAPVVAPDWQLPAPCGFGAEALLASAAPSWIDEWREAVASHGVSAVDFKCADMVRPQGPWKPPSSSRAGGN